MQRLPLALLLLAAGAARAEESTVAVVALAEVQLAPVELPAPPEPPAPPELPIAPEPAPPAPEPLAPAAPAPDLAPQQVPEPAALKFSIEVAVTTKTETETPAPAPAEPQLPTALVHLGLLPGVDWTFLPDTGSAPHAAHLSLNVAGKVAEVRGIEGALFTNWVTGDLIGLEAASLVNWVGGDVTGGQLALLNVGANDVRGAQFGYANVAGARLTGVQFAAIANVAGGLGGHTGLQLGGVTNVARGDLDGGQGSYGVNVVTGDLRGAQVGLLNIGGDVDGAQIGLVNIAGLVRGTQIGLLNVSRDVEGLPIGLLNFASDGRFTVQAFTSDFAPANLSVKVGTSRLYSTVVASFCCTGTLGEELAGAFNTGRERWSTAIGVGYHLPWGDDLWVDLDLTGRLRRHVAPNGRKRAPDVLLTPRVQIGWNPFSSFSAFAGLGLNIAAGASGLPLAPVDGNPYDLPAGEQSRVAVWPAFLAGVEI